VKPPLRQILSSTIPCLLVLTGCAHTAYEASVYSIFGPLAMVAMPGYALSEGVRVVVRSWYKKVYLPPGIPEEQAQQLLEEVGRKSGGVGGRWKNDGTKLLHASGDRTTLYAKIKDGVTVEYPR